MAGQSTPLSLYMPKCSLCFSDARTASHYLVQLSCYHLYCSYCVVDLENAGAYVCPMDRQRSQGHSYNNELVERANWLVTSWSSLNEQQVVGQIQWLKSYINYYNVFCRFEGCAQSIDNTPCPYNHTNILTGVECPKQEKCWRGQTCPFRHQGTGVALSLIQTLPSYEWYISTLQVQAQLQKGSTVIRSQSVFQYLSNNGYAELHAIFNKVLGTVPEFTMHSHQMEFRGSISWLYLPQNGQMLEFNTMASTQLEQTYKMGGTVIIIDAYSSVYLKPLLRLYQNGGFEPVARLEKLYSTSDAGVIEVTCNPDLFNPLYSAIHSIEVEQPIGRLVPGQLLKRLCQQYGLSTRNEYLIGTQYSISQAQAELLTDQSSIFNKVLYIDIPRNYPLTLVKFIADGCSLIIAGSFIYGYSEEMSAFTSMLSFQYASVQKPTHLTPDQTEVLCRQYGLLCEDGWIAGPSQNVTMACSSLQLHSALVPTDVEEARLVSLPSHVPVKVVGGMIQGTKENVDMALQILPRKQERIRFPTSIPKATVQQIAAKYSLRVDNVHLVGDQRSIVRALDELNQLPAQVANPAQGGGGAGFQYHRVPAWYQTQTVELAKQTVQPNTEEFQRVVGLFNKTMGNESRMVGVERIQNKRMYTNFAYKHEAFSKVEGRNLTIMQLFHGTSGTDPAVIYQSDTGLDSRLGKGLWGHGTYYAQNSYYSHDYCYHTQQRQCQMFLCSVIVGDDIELPQDQNLVRPPQKKNSTSNYHSVKGKTETSDIWITYEAAMSYPTWLITYEAEDRNQQVMVLPPIVAAMLFMRMLADANDDDDDS